MTDPAIAKAVKRFWTTRQKQTSKQVTSSSKRDQGTRSAVTGGKQMDGFVDLVARAVHEAGIAHTAIYTRQKTEIPGYFRPEKRWDIVVVDDDALVACLEFKSQVGSFGNNCNNRSEEAIGSATDLWTAYREGAFAAARRPWLGYLMLLEEVAQSTSPVRVKEPHFDVFEEFRSASYAKRYEELLLRLVQERLYDAACLILSNEKAGKNGGYSEPNADLSFRSLMASLHGQIAKHISLKQT